MYIFLQCFCILCAFLGLGGAVDKKATRSEKISSTILLWVSVAVALFIEGVLK